MKRLALIAVSMVAFAGPACADFAAGETAFDRGDFAAAHKEWLPLAEQGDAEAQKKLGYLYRYGHGVPKDGVEAAKWYRMAAVQGDVVAQFTLGLIVRRQNKWAC